MERRNRTIEALERLIYIDSLDGNDKADNLVKWYDTYLKDCEIEDFDLELVELKQLKELFFKNIKFLRKHKEDTRLELVKIKKMKRFLKH